MVSLGGLWDLKKLFWSGRKLFLQQAGQMQGLLHISERRASVCEWFSVVSLLGFYWFHISSLKFAAAWVFPINFLWKISSHFHSIPHQCGIFFGTWAVTRYVNGGNCRKVRKQRTCGKAGSLGAFWKVRKYKPEQEALVMFTLLTKWEAVDRTNKSVAMDNTAEKSEANLRWMGCFFGNSERDLGTPAAWILSPKNLILCVCADREGWWTCSVTLEHKESPVP